VAHFEMRTKLPSWSFRAAAGRGGRRAPRAGGPALTAVRAVHAHLLSPPAWRCAAALPVLQRQCVHTVQPAPASGRKTGRGAACVSAQSGRARPRRCSSTRYPSGLSVSDASEPVTNVFCAARVQHHFTSTSQARCGCAAPLPSARPCPKVSRPPRRRRRCAAAARRRGPPLAIVPAALRLRTPFSRSWPKRRPLGLGTVRSDEWARSVITLRAGDNLPRNQPPRKKTSSWVGSVLPGRALTACRVGELLEDPCLKSAWVAHPGLSQPGPWRLGKPATGALQR